MSEKLQHTAEFTREKMLARYEDPFKHKHNKLHLQYRMHYKSHPVIKTNGMANKNSLKHFNLKKTRTRLAKGHYH